MGLIATIRRAALLPPSQVVAGVRRRAGYAIRQAIPGRAMRSVYGPKLLKRRGDATFYACVTGVYGPMIPEIIRAMPAPFVFLDVGANIGVFSLVAANDRDCERVVAIEPIPDTIDFLRGNLALNHVADRVSVIAGAVADTPGSTISMRSPVGHSGGSRIALDGDIDVPLVCETQIDRALDGTTGTILAKVDVEGTEPGVLAVLRQCRHYARINRMVVEVTEHPQTDATAEVRRMLKEDGFSEVGSSSNAPLHDAYFTRVDGSQIDAKDLLVVYEG